uniref:Schnurri n=1 Tax=Anopheles atroparvus TaxID=41427 RepID=A0A182JF34_ANOAO
MLHVHFGFHDPGGGVAGGGGAKPAMEVTNHRHESRPSQLRQLANGGGGNEGDQTKQTSTETVRSSGSTANNATARNTSPATTNSTTTTTVEHYKSCSSSIPSVPAPPTASSVSASSNLKYLHKKFKRIASATLMEEDDAPNLKERERERESTTTVREPATGNSSLSLQSHQHQQQQLVTVVRPSATVAPLVSHTITSSSSASRPSVDNCDLSVANKLAKSPYSPLGGGAVQYIVAYPQHHQQQQPPPIDQGPKYHSSLHYTNGAVSAVVEPRPQPPHRTGGLSSASSGGSSGSPSPPSSVVSNLGTSSAHHTTSSGSASLVASGGTAVNTAVVGPGPPGRYVCPYCQMNCSKPSVLEKHIRRHTNERPFKCDLCGIAFKTKSNLYKHRRQCEDPNGLSLLDDDGGSLGGSDIDDKELSNSGSEIMNYRGSPLDERVNSPQQLLVEKPYKPKFHNAALYTKVENKPIATVGPVGGLGLIGPQQAPNNASAGSAPVSHYLNGQNVESLEQHISKLISQNEAIVEVVEAPLQKKYHKITGISRGISVPVSVSERGMAIATTTQSAFLVQQPLEAGETLQHPMPLYLPSSAVTTVSASSASQPPHVPLHVQVSSAGTSSGSVHRPTATPTPPLTVANHPQNPERSIIKDLLLNSRAFGVVQNPDGENGDNLYTCKMCNVSFRDVDSLKYHMICYCQGSGSNLNSPSSSSAPISPVGSPSSAAASYIRSRSVSSLKQLARSSLNPPSARTPSSLSKLAKSQLTRPRTKPENISLPSDSSSSSSVQSSTGSNAGNNPSLAPTHQVAGSLLAIQQPTASTPASSRIGGPAGTSLTYAHIVEAPKKQLAGVPKNGLSVREIWSPAKQQQQQQLQADFSSPSPTQAVSRKSFNFTRMADNVSPRRKADIPPLHLSVADSKAKPDEVRYFNFETMISTSEIMIKPPPPPPPPPPAPSSSATTALSVDTSSGAVGSQQESIQNAPVPPSPRPNKFLRPNTLPLKPGTFTPKRHHGITPTNNTMPLISPETPRPSKSCRELYFNGHAYTNIGLKSSTKPFYCTVNKTQPFYFQTQKQLSMYSNWQVHPENDPHPLGLRQVTVMALYDSNHHRDRRYAIAGPRKIPLAIVASRPAGGDVVSCLSGEGQVRVSPIEVKSNVPCSPAYVLATLASQQPPTITTMTPSFLPTHYSRESLSPGQQYSEKSKSSTDQALAGSEPSLMMGTSVGGGGSRHPSRSASAERALSGGFESTEEYTYVRGRGRGKYVCNECGIRCKKPSMLKKHIRTHTDVRPYSCQYCSFHFKTKGNLTKHMKSKSHFKKCTELGLNPVPVHVDDDGGDIDIEGDQQSVSSERTSTIPGDSDTATDTDGDETDDSEEMKSRLPEHEAAEGLLSLSMTRPTSACSSLGTGHQPSVGSSMEPTAAAEEAYMKQHISSYLTPEQQQSHGLLNSTSSPNPPHSPMTIVQLQQEQDPTVKLDGGSLTHPRRIITYGNGPKLEYNLLKHEQYYSDPNLGSKKKREHERSFPNASDEAARAGDADDEDDTARPIDLTKKPRHQPSARGGEIVAEVSLPIKSSTHQYNDRRGMSFHQLQQASASAPQQPLAMVTPHQSSQQMPVEHNHPMIRPLDREQLALHQQMYENRPPSKQPDQQQPQQVIVRVSDVLTPISGTANLLTTLVSNTDKIPLIVTPFEPSGGTTPGGVDENSYFHEYLKERALQDTRIKQSQMKPGSSIVMRDAPSPHQHGHPQPQHAQFPQDQIMYNFQQQHVPLQPCYEDAHAPVNVGPSMVAVVAQATLATKATPPPAALPPLTATVIPPASAATAPTTSTAPPERVYRIFSGKNERHRASPTAEATVKSVPVSHTEPPTLPEVKHSGETVRSKYVAVEADGKHNASCVSGSATVPPSVVTTSNNTLQLVSSASLRVLGNECPLVSENASPMDTLAEIAAGSVKLDVSKVQQQLSFVSEPLPMMPTPTPVTTNVRSRCNSINSSAKVAPPPVPESAKNLASEYLKLAQSVTSKRKRADSESAAGGVSDHETSSLSIPVPVVPVVPVVMAPVAEGVQKPIATVAPIVANIAPLPSTQQQQQQQQQQQLQPTGTSAGNGNSSTVSGNGSNVQAVEVATGGGIGPARKVVVVGEDGFKKTVGGGRPVASAGGEFVGTPPSAFTPSMHQEDGGRPVCEICNKKFHKLSQLSIHMNIHYMERKYRCEPCGTSFRSQGLYLKHERSATHRNKVSMTTTFGVATDTNPRPFYCRDCEVGFRIHGHLAKHLRSKMHVLKLECLGKLPFGTYTEIERSGTNLTEIDTSDCENSLSSLKRLAVRLNVKDPAKVLPAGGSAAGSSSSSTSSTGSGGAMGAVGGVGGGTSGNETDSCDDNFGLENGEDEFPLGAGGSKGETTPDDVSHSQRAIVNGEKGIDGVSDGALETATTCNGGRELRNINNNVKRKIDDMPSVGKGVEEATCSNSGGVLSEAKRPRYSLELLDGAGSSDVPAEGGVSTSG